MRLVGWSTRTTAGRGGVFRCPSCRTMEPYRHTRARRWLTVLGVAVTPAGPAGGLVSCATCSRGYEESVLEWRRTTIAERLVPSEAPAA